MLPVHKSRKLQATLSLRNESLSCSHRYFFGGEGGGGILMLLVVAPELIRPISFFILYDIGENNSGAMLCRYALSIYNRTSASIHKHLCQNSEFRFRILLSKG